MKTEEPPPGTDPPPQDGKKKGSISSRTGTACDRCRVRKMRCDDRPEGCAACQQAGQECKTTDRITGKATVRGYVDSLEGRLAELERQNATLREQMRNMSIQASTESRAPDNNNKFMEPSPSQVGAEMSSTQTPQVPAGYASFGLSDSWDAQQRNLASPAPPPAAKAAPTERRIKLPEFRSGLDGNNYVGVSIGNTLMSSVRGTSMSVLGMEIDLADYCSPDLDEPDPLKDNQPMYNKSYSAFIRTSFGLNPKLNEPSLPPRDEGIEKADIYFRVTNPYVFVLHKPTFMRVLLRMYDDVQFTPTPAERVMVHTMFAIIYHQWSQRGAKSQEHNRQLTNISNAHYHYALGFFPELMASHTLADVQALTVLCIYHRNNPKPGPSWMLNSIALDLAIEMGLHRSAKNWPSAARPDAVELETRKRVFWSLIWVQTMVGGCLGRPMALRSSDWDVEMPEMLDDEIEEDDSMGRGNISKCNFQMGMQCFKLAAIHVDLYNEIYAVRRSQTDFEKTVRSMEKRVDQFVREIPSELTDENASKNEVGRMHLQYLQMWQLHIRLLLRHPSLSLSVSPSFNAQSVTICLEVSKQILQHVKLLQNWRSLDGTWQTSTLFVLVIASLLYGHWERRDKLTMHEFNSLCTDMQDWLSILQDVDVLIASGGRLHDRMRAIMHSATTILSQHIISRAAPSSDALQPRCAGPQMQPTNSTIGAQIKDAYKLYAETTKDPQQQPQRSDPGLNASNNASYASASVPPPHHPTDAYQNTQTYPYSYYPTKDVPLATHPNAVPSHPMSSSASTTPYLPSSASFQQTTFPQTQPLVNGSGSYPTTSPTGDMFPDIPGGPAAWRTFAGNIMSSLDATSTDTTQGYFSSPSTFSNNTNATDIKQEQGAGPGDENRNLRAHMLNIEPGQMWPMMILDPDPNEGM